MAVQSTQSTNAASDIFAAINASGKSTSAASATEEAQDKFLTLLVTQLKNQDPLNPMDNAEMTSQLAQMSTVSGIEKVNATLSTLLDSVGNAQSMQAAAMIGKTVLVPGSGLALTEGTAFGGVNLASAADQVTISVLDSAGNVVETQKLGAHDAGSFTFAWDGSTNSGSKAADGAYTFKVDAVQGSTPVTVDALQLGTVSALVRTASGFLLDLGKQGTVDFKNVQQIF
jgi:flagellar basal-body rod modification protein FlgD